MDIKYIKYILSDLREVIDMFQCKMAPVLKERTMAKEGESGDNVKKDKAVLMNLKKQSNYRERKAKAKKNMEEKRKGQKRKNSSLLETELGMFQRRSALSRIQAKS